MLPEERRHIACNADVYSVKGKRVRPQVIKMHGGNANTNVKEGPSIVQKETYKVGKCVQYRVDVIQPRVDNAHV